MATQQAYRLDEYTRGHLSNWVMKTYPMNENADDIYIGIMAFVARHPVVLQRGDSWPEIKRLVDRA